MKVSDTNQTHFRGWAKPGPIPPGAHLPLEVPADETLDAISGHFRIYQLRKGHRFSTDDVLTAWYGTTWAPSPRDVLDLGSGIGSVGMIAAWRLPGARFVTIEAQEESVRLARKSAEYNGLTDRYEIRLGDFRLASAAKAARYVRGRDNVRRAELQLGPDELFDLVLASPPYFPLGTGIEGDHPQKIAARFELRGDIRDYCTAAAKHLSHGGLFACVFPDGERRRVDDATRAARLAIIRRRPVVFREGEPPLISLFAMMRDEDLPEDFRTRTWVEPPLVIRCADGSVHPEYTAIKLSVGFPP